MPYSLNGEPLAHGEAFTVAEVQYPANVLDLWGRADLEALGLVWTDPPPLFEMRSPHAVNAVEALDALMDLAEAGGTDADAVVDILAAFDDPLAHPLHLHVLGALRPQAWAHVALTLDMLRLTNGVRACDFRDGGRRFRSIVDRPEQSAS